MIVSERTVKAHSRNISDNGRQIEDSKSELIALVTDERQPHTTSSKPEIKAEIHCNCTLN